MKEKLDYFILATLCCGLFGQAFAQTQDELNDPSRQKNIRDAYHYWTSVRPARQYSDAIYNDRNALGSAAKLAIVDYFSKQISQAQTEAYAGAEHYQDYTAVGRWIDFEKSQTRWWQEEATLLESNPRAGGIMTAAVARHAVDENNNFLLSLTQDYNAHEHITRNADTQNGLAGDNAGLTSNFSFLGIYLNRPLTISAVSCDIGEIGATSSKFCYDKPSGNDNEYTLRNTQNISGVVAYTLNAYLDYSGIVYRVVFSGPSAFSEDEIKNNNKKFSNMLRIRYGNPYTEKPQLVLNQVPVIQQTWKIDGLFLEHYNDNSPAGPSDLIVVTDQARRNAYLTEEKNKNDTQEQNDEKNGAKNF